MRKNVASQIVGAQVNSKTDGSPVTTGTTTAFVTGDGGTQATGSVGSGACTHEGHGFWTYAPAQAETNYDHVAFTFENSAGVNATVQIYPSFPQTGDNFVRLGAPAGASIAADAAAIKVDTAAIKTKTDFLPSATAGAAGGVFIAGSNAATTVNITGNVTGNLSGSVGSVTGAVGSVTGLTASDVGAIKAKTDNLPASPAAVSDIPTAAAVSDAVWDELLSGHVVSGSTGAGLSAAGAAGDPWSTPLPGSYGAGTAGKIVGDNIDATITSRTKPADTQAAVTTVTNLTNAPTAGDLTATMKTSVTTAATAATPTAAAVTGAVGSVTGNVGGNVAGSVASVTTVSDKTGYRLSATGVDDVLDEVVDGATTLRESIRLANATLGGKASGLATTSVAYRDLADTKDRVSATVDADGNRSAVTLDLAP